MTTKKAHGLANDVELEKFNYDICFGPDTAAKPGMVMVRISRAGRVLTEEHLPPEEFLILASGFENVAAGVRNVMNGRPVG